ncbi:MAG: DUF924 family protein [Pseudomonadota bacterium]
MKNWCADILRFWFDDTAPTNWFQVNADFDATVTQRFSKAYEMGCDGVFDGWQTNADGALALIVLLDQFPRNMFRNTPAAFASDAQALSVARKAVQAGFDLIHPPIRRRFMYLPFEHSESLDDQNQSVALFSKMQFDDPLGYEYALRHRHVIQAFGRFPHRNAILGRESVAAEKEFLGKLASGF